MARRAIQPRDRQQILNSTRQLKMAQSAHAYVRGSTFKFYEWLESANAANLPQGPAVWICGDCHVGNLGPVASTDGHVEIQIRDLDHTVIGNPAHDLVRLALSLAMAARSSDLPGVTTALMVEKMIDGYQRALSPTRATPAGTHIAPIRLMMKQALRRRWRHLAEERLEDVTPSIPLGKRFWMLSKEERQEIEALFESEETRRLITCLRHREDDDAVTVLDAAYWMKGCSSLGRLRYAVLVGIGKNSKNGMCLIDIKEAAETAAPRSGKSKMPRGHAERIVQGAQHLSPFLGERMLAARMGGHSVVLRELMPQDLKFEIDTLSRDEALQIAHFLAGVVGKSHARQMSSAERKAWAAELNRSRTRKLDAPSWLWQSIVDLVSIHEAAYLEHCHRYALEGSAPRTTPRKT